MRNTRPAQFRSADHPRADLKATARHFAFGPTGDIKGGPERNAGGAGSSAPCSRLPANRELLVQIDIRPAAVTDAEAIQRIYTPIVENTAISFEYVPPSVAEMAERITSSSRTHPYLVAVAKGKQRKSASYATRPLAEPAFRSCASALSGEDIWRAPRKVEGTGSASRALDCSMMARARINNSASCRWIGRKTMFLVGAMTVDPPEQKRLMIYLGSFDPRRNANRNC
jgi:hypothetical protein